MSKALTYTLIVEAYPEEAGYLAFFPALPGCHTWGDAFEAAVKNADEVLIGYLEALQKSGQSIPGAP
jgi:antitoxin HicB